MSSSLVEMIAAIALAGIIFAGALIPVTSSLHEYQETEVALQRDQAQRLAALRIEQTMQTLWRSDAPPADSDTLTAAQPQRIANSSFELRQSSDTLVQVPTGGNAAVLTRPVGSLAIKYLLDDGTWDSSVNAGDLSRVIAARYSWKDTQSGQVYRGYVPTSDLALANSVLMLPAPEDPEVIYRRENYERTISLGVEAW